MISVADARARILAAFKPVGAEQVGLAEAAGRTLAEPATARLTQPPRAVSAMDGYAVRAVDVASAPARLKVVGIVPAGHPLAGAVGAGEAARIFTGAPLPDGTDTIVIQENTAAEPGAVLVKESAPLGKFVRRAGLDFAEGEALLAPGQVLSARDIGLAAAMNRPWLAVRRKPRIAILATGDEIVQPGEPLAPGQIVSSNAWALAAFVAANGGVPVNLGIAADDAGALIAMAGAAAGCDLLVTTGGASVGDHDLVQSALGQAGLQVDFWKIAMRPGKPLMFGTLGATPLLGLPGNPVSTLVCAMLFLGPILRTLLGHAEVPPPLVSATLGAALKANDGREDYLRAKLERRRDGTLVAEAHPVQDSSMIAVLSRSDGLIVRPPHAPPAPAGATVDVLPFAPSGSII